ncbi:MAG TPA: sigma-70 family RNA polymerase sigma factor [Candidatus Tumulicola sp.]|jgi:RNA polymerase sigma-B factor
MIQALSTIELWYRYRRPEHRERLVEEHRYLCVRAARRFVRPNLDRADLEQVATIGLIKAVDRYDPAQQTPFEAYAWVLILGELMHFVRDGERMVRAPRRLRDLERRWVTAERELWNLLGREPLEEDVARHIGANAQDRRDVREFRASGTVVSFELLAPQLQGESTAPFDEVIDKLTLDRLFRSVSPLEATIVRSIHLEGATMVDLAHRLGYSRRHLTRLHRAAIERLRRAADAGASFQEPHPKSTKTFGLWT